MAFSVCVVLAKLLEYLRPSFLHMIPHREPTMLRIGSFETRCCSGVNRRAFVRAGAVLPLLAGLPSTAKSSLDRPNASRKHHGQAKSVMMVWLWGGPSHIDTFDPKPQASNGIRGPFKSIATQTPGLHFTELLPRLAQRTNHLTVVRSTRFSGAHDMLVLTGSRRSGAQQDPNFGSIIARDRTVVGIPSFVSVVPRTVLTHGFQCNKVPGHDAGRFGAGYNPFFVRCASDSQVSIPSLQLMEGLTPTRLADRRLLQAEMDKLKQFVDSPAMEVLDQQNDSAFTMLTSKEAIQAFDLSREEPRTVAAYGRTSFGQSLLLGRRLVEAGVPYVHVNWSLGVDGLAEDATMGWDTHRNGFGQIMTHHCPTFDRAFSALLDDMHDRGLLDSTLIVATGEMGRTPKINDEGGRDHWATCSTLWAGGGVEGGRVIGATDSRGGEPVTKPISSLQVGATIAEAMGIDSQRRAEMKVLTGGSVIDGML